MAEIRERMAFGAEPGSILKLVLGPGLTMAGAEVLAGLVAAVACQRPQRAGAAEEAAGFFFDVPTSSLR
jgi:hypothetical protein